jgi:uncharacterized membrane protein
MQNMNGKTALGLDANIGAMLCYVANFIPCFVPLGLVYSIIVIVQDKTNKLARFHAFQSIFLAIASIPLMIIYFVGFGIAFAIDTALGFPIFIFIVWLIVVLLGLAIFIGVIYSAIKAFQGEIFKLPVIGNFADQYSN